VPDGIKAAWRSWEAAEWRQAQYRATSRLYPPDERFNVRLPDGLCERHAQNWLDWRNKRFDPVTGDAWPGTPGSPFLFVGHDMDDLREQRRVEWDEKSSLEMRKVERACRSGRSDGCRPLNRAVAKAVAA
jgi:hypothetical protein